MSWIKLHRQITESSVWKNERLLKVWLWCLVRANHRETKASMNGAEITVPVGGFITGRFAGAEECDLPPSTFRRCMDRLESLGMLTSKPDNKKTLYVVVKYSDYQGDESTSGQPMDNKRTTSGQQVDTDKKRRRKKEDMSVAESIYDHYASEIKSGGRSDAVKSIGKLLTSGLTAEHLIGCIDRYAEEIRKNGTSRQYMSQANNFFGMKAKYLDFEERSEPQQPEQPNFLMEVFAMNQNADDCNTNRYN